MVLFPFSSVSFCQRGCSREGARGEGGVPLPEAIRARKRACPPSWAREREREIERERFSSSISRVLLARRRGTDSAFISLLLSTMKNASAWHRAAASASTGASQAVKGDMAFLSTSPPPLLAAAAARRRRRKRFSPVPPAPPCPWSAGRAP